MNLRILKRFLQIFYISTVSFILVINYTDVSNPWGDWYYDPGPWCEKERTEYWIREPSNCIADFLFYAFCLYLIYKGFEDRENNKYQSIGQINKNSNIIIQNPGLTFIAVILQFTHFFGTFWNHACRCHPGHRLDVVGMYSITSYPGIIWIISYFYSEKLDERGKINKKQWLQIISAWSLLICFYIWVSDYWYVNPMWEVVEISIMVIISVVTLIIDNKVSNSLQYQLEKKQLGVGVLLLVIGVIAHNLDMKKIFCYPESPVQGHSIWHSVTAVAVYVVYQYQRQPMIKQSAKIY
ncbi:hypothetical protein PPERSA_00251 [Pseudocohnilembus persalinus]|uniref:Ceramidase n=1 Tax=Pseudocohnilembus persalinus TaxID=266149 RepID=A0A0V0Q9E9_PSEPJ|nr:hypothetical protein PPERSA_00251 [Pseudocohnilembus persalinus]|eukprot:KRW98663.1 hypothetical protein PPERSA_00251 [Pseudocohnilembus persalinus]